MRQPNAQSESPVHRSIAKQAFEAMASTIGAVRFFSRLVGPTEEVGIAAKRPTDTGQSHSGRGVVGGRLHLREGASNRSGVAG
jgi:hypothetical protein